MYPISTWHSSYLPDDRGYSFGLHNKFINSYSNAELNHITVTDNQERMALYNSNNVAIYKKYLKENII
jgi:hypothetical protein